MSDANLPEGVKQSDIDATVGETVDPELCEHEHVQCENCQKTMRELEESEKFARHSNFDAMVRAGKLQDQLTERDREIERLKNTPQERRQCGHEGDCSCLIDRIKKPLQDKILALEAVVAEMAKSLEHIRDIFEDVIKIKGSTELVYAVDRLISNPLASEAVEKVKGMGEVLRFYEIESHYQNTILVCHSGDEPLYTSEIYKDNGQRARLALGRE